MNININHYFNYEESLSTLVDGFCNHFGTDMEMSVREFYNPDGQDMVEDTLTEICTRCGSYRNVYEDEKSEWFGIGIMPMIPVVNSGKVFQDVR